MDNESLFDKFRQSVGSIGWKMFLWGNKTTEEIFLKSLRNEIEIERLTDTKKGE